MRPATPLALLLAALPARAQVCAPRAPGGHPYRPAMTHRAPGTTTAAGISVATLQAWSPPANVEDDGVRTRDGAIDAREERSATLEGDVWRVKVGDDGCTLTMELTATQAGSAAPHVVVAIPAGVGYEAARAAIWTAVGRRSGRIELAAPVHVRLTGWVFWNGDQWCRESPGRGCGHRAEVVASLWELRPVWRVEVLGAAAGSEGGEPRSERHHGHREHREHREHRDGR